MHARPRSCPSLADSAPSGGSRRRAREPASWLSARFRAPLTGADDRDSTLGF